MKIILFEDFFQEKVSYITHNKGEDLRHHFESQ